ncbi:MAG: long-chain fatty acid--CoA ligase [Peptococcaceae bacterium]|nr:long-chain fatty acid--CoA ligase [Peptococcaceae bacterium]
MKDWGWIIDLAGRMAALIPGREALADADTGRRYTWRELNARANRLANYLRAGLGLGKGDRVAVLSRNCPEYFDFFFATQKLGLVLVPLNFRLADEEIVDLVKMIGIAVLAYEDFFEERARRIINGAGVAHSIGWGETVTGGTADYSAVLRDGSDTDPARAPLEIEDPHLILFTGGTTGLPKGAVISHRAVYWNMVSEVLSWNLGPADTIFHVLPLFHTGGWNIVTLPTLFAGGTLIISRKFDPEMTLKIIDQYRCSLFFAAATMFMMMSQAGYFRRADLTSLKFMMSGAAPCPRSVMEPYWERNIPFMQGYGITEGGPNNLFMPFQRLSMNQIKEKWNSVGVPFLYCRARVADEGGAEAGPGQMGELLLSGPVVFSGYWNNPEASAATLVDGWVHTGDIAVRDEEGFFYIVDRKKDMFISGGENVFPVEVEKVIAAHPQVAEVAVIGVPDPTWGEVGRAFVVPRPGQRPDPADIVKFAGERLGRYKVPRYVEIIDALPKSAVGKVLKKNLRQLSLKK